MNADVGPERLTVYYEFSRLMEARASKRITCIRSIFARPVSESGSQRSTGLKLSKWDADGGQYRSGSSVSQFNPEMNG